MNIEQAKAIPMSTLLEKLNAKVAKQKNHEAWYLSPLRVENTASFKVDTKKNIWYDFGEGKGGDSINFVCCYLASVNESSNVADALRWISNMAGQTPYIRQVVTKPKKQNDRSLFLKGIQKIEHRLLLKYLAQRGITIPIAEKYLKQLRIYNSETKKHFFALGFANEDKGFEIRNPFFKGCIGSKDITFIRGRIPQPMGIHVFEGFMDFLSVLSHKNVDTLDQDCIVLNSLSCLQMATPYIKNYGYRIAYSWMDNDKAGFKATNALDDFFQTEECLTHLPMNRVYAPHKDVNTWHMHKLGLGI